MSDLSKIKRQWIFSEYYGFPKAPEAADCIYYGKSLLCIANADGTLADEERRWIMGFSYTNGVSWDEVSSWSNYQANDKITDLLAKRPLLNFAARSVIYDAIRACAADNDYNSKEQSMVRKVGSALGLTESDVAALEGAFHAENGAKKKRIEVIFPGRISGRVPAVDPLTLSEAWMMHEYYGLDTPPSARTIEIYAMLLLCMANSDGNLSPAERDWVIGFAACSGVSGDGIERLSSYAGTDDIESLVQESKVVADARRAVVYDAIRACDADAEFSEAEKTAVRRAAQRLGVTQDEVAAIESAWAAEKTAKLARQALVFPQISEMALPMGA
jgi:uncharacterized tellurite resistance protein B-like protein